MKFQNLLPGLVSSNSAYPNIPNGYIIVSKPAAYIMPMIISK